jgi:hypothetical protein
VAAAWDFLSDRHAATAVHFAEFPLLWLVEADLPGAVIAQDSEGQLLPAEEKSETREANKEEVLRFSLAGVQLKFSAIGRGGRQLPQDRRATPARATFQGACRQPKTEAKEKLDCEYRA